MLQHQEVEDINHKYSGTILYLNGDPVMCQDGVAHRFAVNEKAVSVIRYYPIGSDRIAEPKMIRADDPILSDGPYLLGYMNKVRSVSSDGDSINVCCFVSRVPIRRWKQGICQENLHFQGGMMNFRTACKIPEFSKMLRNEYPTFKQALKSLDDETRGIAYHRHWAVIQNKTGNIDINYRGQLVGTGEDAASIKLGPKFEYLQAYYKLSRE
jgi:hypothetical protein